MKKRKTRFAKKHLKKIENKIQYDLLDNFYCYTKELVENKFKIGYLYMPINSIKQIEPSRKTVNKNKIGGCLILSNNLSVSTIYNENIFNQFNINTIMIGNNFKGIYKSANGYLFDRRSITIEILDVDNDTLREVAKQLCNKYKQGEVIIRFFDNSPIEYTNIIRLFKVIYTDKNGQRQETSICSSSSQEVKEYITHRYLNANNRT